MRAEYTVVDFLLTACNIFQKYSYSRTMFKSRPPSKPNIPQPLNVAQRSGHHSSLMVLRAVASARRHGISLCEGTLNSADGNCSIESVLFNINDRQCFPDKFTLSADYYRRIWVTDFKNRTSDDPTWKICSSIQWEAGWSQMLESGVYERDFFGDLMMFAIACGVKKVLLIFNTNLNSPHDPIYVCDPRKFGVEPDTPVPVVLAYDMAYYESLHPLTSLDTHRSCGLVDQYLSGNYGFGKQDLPYLLDTDAPQASTDKCNSTNFEPKVDEGERPMGSKLFDDSLPLNLRGKRPKEMSPEERKEYNSFRRKMARANQSEE